MSETPHYGLTLVAPGDNPRVDIVFLDGLRGEMEKTWTKDGVLWPAKLLSKNFPDSRIFLFGYDSGIIHRNREDITKTEIHSHADDLCAKLTAERSMSHTEDRPIIIVSHSLGGLVAAQLFVHGEQGNEGSSAKNVVRNIRGLIFFGTPFRSPAESARKILEWIGVETQEQTLKLLGVDSESLKELTRAFANMLNKRRTSKDTNERIDAFFFYETLPTKIGLRYIQVVEPESAQLPGCGDNVPIRANHRDVCKFTSNEDEGYGTVVAAITKILAPPDADDSEGGGSNTWINNYGKAVNVGKISIGSQHIQFS